MEETRPKKVILYIINPISGIGKKKNIEELIRDHTDASTYDYHVKFTKGPGHGTARCIASRRTIIHRA